MEEEMFELILFRKGSFISKEDDDYITKCIMKICEYNNELSSKLMNEAKKQAKVLLGIYSKDDCVQKRNSFISMGVTCQMKIMTQIIPIKK